MYLHYILTLLSLLITSYHIKSKVKSMSELKLSCIIQLCILVKVDPLKLMFKPKLSHLIKSGLSLLRDAMRLSQKRQRRLPKYIHGASYPSHPNQVINTRQDSQIVVENKCNTTRCYNAPHNYLARLANQNQDKIKTGS